MEDVIMTDLQICDMPPEILMNIFSFLDFYDLQSARLCCKQWFAITQLPAFDSKGVFTIAACTLESNHPAAEVMLNMKVDKLHLDDVRFGDVDELFHHVGSSLKELSLMSLPITDALRLTFAHFTNIQSLKVTVIESAIHLNNLDSLQCVELSRLKELELFSKSSQLNTFLLACTPRNESLERLQIDFFKSDEQDLLRVIDTHARTLKRLHLSYCHSAKLEALQWTWVFGKLNLFELSLQGNVRRSIMRAATEHQKQLRLLNVTGSVSVNEKFLTALVLSTPALERINLSYCGRLTNAGVMQLAKLSRLKVVDLTCCNLVKGEGVRGMIGETPNFRLQELYLADVEIDEDTICFCLKNLKNLRVLNLNGCMKLTKRVAKGLLQGSFKLRELHLEFTHGFAYADTFGHSCIEHLQSLQLLNLSGCKGVCDDFLRLGLKLPQLKILDISHCSQVTKEGLSTLPTNCPTIEEMYLSLNKGVDIAELHSLAIGLKRLRKLTVIWLFSKRTPEMLGFILPNSQSQSSSPPYDEVTFTHNRYQFPSLWDLQHRFV